LRIRGGRHHLFVNISSSPFTMGKAALRRHMVRQQAIKHGGRSST
jgi:hypothetical protein